MSSPTPKVPNYRSDQRSMSYGSPMARQPSWDSVHTLTDSMSKMTVRNPASTNATSPNPPSANAPGHRRGSASDSSSSSAPIITPIPSREADAAYTGANQPGHVTPGYQYRGPNTPGTLGKPDEVLQVDYNLQPRHFIPGSMTSPQQPSATTGAANGARANGAPNGAAAPFVPGAFSGNNGFYGQPAGYPAQGGGAENKAAQDIAAQIALSALQGLNAPMQNQPGQPNPAALNPALAAAAAAAAAGYNSNLLPGLYGNPLYGGVNGAAPPGAQGFYPGQENMAAAVANAVAQLPPGAFQAALQNVGLAAYPLNGLPGAVPGMNVGMPGMMGVGPGAAGMMAAAGGLQQGGPSANNRKLGLYKTELCRSWEEKGTCRYGPKCQFAHGEDELKRVQRHPKYKTEICRTFWLSGSCPYGKRCCFIHTELPAGGGGEENGQDGPSARDREEAIQRERERERAQQIANSDSEQQQTSMLARIRRDPSNANNGANTPSPPVLHQNQGMHQVNGHGTIGGSAPTAAAVNMTPGSGRPTLGALRVDTAAINDTTVPKNSYPYTSNPAMPAPGLSLATDGLVRGRLSPVPATAGPDFGRNAAARMEVVGVSPQSGSQTPQPGNGPRGHLRSVSQTFPSSIASAVEPTRAGRASPAAGNVHTRADSWGANTLIAPASAVEPSARYGEHKW